MMIIFLLVSPIIVAESTFNKDNHSKDYMFWFYAFIPQMISGFILFGFANYIFEKFGLINYGDELIEIKNSDYEEEEGLLM